jgi:uncharacterized protein (TIGR00299 family) protein
MTGSRVAILDPSAGISGDMLLGALVDAGAPVAWLEGLPARLGLPGVRIETSRASRGGVQCTKVTVRMPDGSTEGPGESAPQRQHTNHARDDHDHHGPGGHRHLPQILDIIDRADLSEMVRQRARQAFRLLCEEEGRVHGVSPESVVLHEVGAVDAIVDIVGGIEGFEQLGVDRVFNRPVALGQGWARAAHGVLAVPAPVTLRLLEGIEIATGGPVEGEATTPTGAVLLRVLSGGPAPARWRPRRVGWGAGTRDPVHYPNALRLILADPALEAGEVVSLSSDVDDLSPEYLDPLREALTAAGALDVQIWGIHMKKGRPGFRIEVLCDPGASQEVTEAFFLHSTTAGIRRSVQERVTLARRQVEIIVRSGGTVGVKVLETSRGPRVKAEFEDVRRVAAHLGRPAFEVAREVEAQARALLAGTGQTGPNSSGERE